MEKASAAGRPVIKLSPSILAADFARLGEDVRRLDAAGADMVHIDVMDGDFVPNISIGPPVVKSLRGLTALPFDVHLMISQPERHIAAFADAGANIITVHAEACDHLSRTLQLIRSLGAVPSVALNPHTPPDFLEWVLGDLGLVLVMTVNPGYGGQKFISRMLDKVRVVRDMANRAGRVIDIEVDGGVGTGNAAEIAAAGANVLVAGTAVFHAADMRAALDTMRNAATGAMAAGGA